MGGRNELIDLSPWELGYVIAVIVIWSITLYSRRGILHCTKGVITTIIVFVMSGVAYFSRIFLGNEGYILFITGFGTLIVTFTPYILLTIAELDLKKEEYKKLYEKINGLYKDKKQIIKVFITLSYRRKSLEIKNFVSFINEMKEKKEVSKEAAEEVLHYFQ